MALLVPTATEPINLALLALGWLHASLASAGAPHGTGEAVELLTKFKETSLVLSPIFCLVFRRWRVPQNHIAPVHPHLQLREFRSQMAERTLR
jgi:hypothetical protein